MPAKKPQSLNQRHSTKDEIEEREAAEAAITPTTQLTSSPPPLLQKQRRAGESWRRLIGLYFEVEGTIITAFDADVLAQYCLVEAEIVEWQDDKAKLKKDIERVRKLMTNKEKAKQFDAELYVTLLQQLNALNARMQGFDARLDAKRKLLHSLAQSLYITPRSRAGVAPVEKPQKPKDDFGDKFD